jgi:hypothetical protein
MARRLPWLGLALAACGSGGDLPRCGSDADCGAGTVCERPVGGERGVCVAPYSVAISMPSSGDWVGAAAATVRATLRVQASGRAEPAALDLLAGGAAAASLPRVGPGLYQGSWIAPAGTPASTQLTAVAALGTADESRSAPVPVRVDLDAPAIASLSATCPSAPCVRDQVMRIQAAVTDANLVAVAASIDLDPARAVPLARVGAAWQADVDLGGWPFAALARDVVVGFTATDAAGNRTALNLPVPLTRVRWSYDAGAPLTSPAVMADGTLVVGLSATSNQLRALRPDGSLLWQATVGTAFVTAAPSIGPTAIWVASMDGRVYAVKGDGSAVLNGSGCATGGAVQGTPAVGSGNPETAFAGSTAGRLFAIDPGATCVRSPLTDAFAAPPALDQSGAILAATATATATLRQFAYDGAFTERWNTSVGVSVSAPIAIDASGNAWTGSQDAKLDFTTPAGLTTTARTLGGSIVDSPIVLAGGDVVVGDQARVLHRLRPDGSQAWAVEPVLGGPVLAPVALAGGPAALLVPTAAGTLHAVAADGTVLWGGALTAGQSLREAAVRAPAAGPSGTAYLSAADGKLYAVAIEGHLDSAAPWPKAHRDLRNSSNAAGPLP